MRDAIVGAFVVRQADGAVDELLTVGEVAAILKLNPQTVQNWIYLTVGDYGRCVDLPVHRAPGSLKSDVRGKRRLAVNGCERRWTVSAKPDGEPG